jgi:hypothetical protein
MPGQKDRLFSPDGTLVKKAAASAIQTGKRGGKYIITKSGSKLYLKV